MGMKLVRATFTGFPDIMNDRLLIRLIVEYALNQAIHDLDVRTLFSGVLAHPDKTVLFRMTVAL